MSGTSALRCYNKRGMDDLRNPRAGKLLTAAWLIGLALFSQIGCENLRNPALGDLENPDPIIRLRAIRWSGNEWADQGITAAPVPLLVDRLQEQDRSIRFYSIRALQEIVGEEAEDYGYDYQADATKRAEAVERWRMALRKSR